jgi:hypothetical protein
MNVLLIISAIEAGLRATQELTALLQKAQTENRDVTDDEVSALADSNSLLSEQIIKNLGG